MTGVAIAALPDEYHAARRAAARGGMAAHRLSADAANPNAAPDERSPLGAHAASPTLPSPTPAWAAASVGGSSWLRLRASLARRQQLVPLTTAVHKVP